MVHEATKCQIDQMVFGEISRRQSQFSFVASSKDVIFFLFLSFSFENVDQLLLLVTLIMKLGRVLTLMQ